MVTEELLALELRGRHGVSTRKRLRARGVTDREIARLRKSGRLLGRGRGVVVDAAAPETLLQLVAIACAVTGGVVMFPTAGQIWRFRGTPRGHVIHIAIPWHRRVSPVPGVVLHRTMCLPREDIVRRADGIVMTSPPRTVFDAAAVVSAEVLESMIEQGIERRMFIVVTLARLSARLYSTARAGATQFRTVLASRPAWCKPVRSDLELQLARAMQARGFPPLVREHPVPLASGVTVHPDLGVLEDQFFVEVDHFTWHGGRGPSTYDRRRDTQVRMTGAVVERVTDLAIETQLDATVEDLYQLWQCHRGELCTVSVHNSPR